MTATLEEGTTQQIALHNSSERYLLVDSSKLDCEDFYTFFSLNKLTALITDQTDAEFNKSISATIPIY